MRAKQKAEYQAKQQQAHVEKGVKSLRGPKGDKDDNGRGTS